MEDDELVKRVRACWPQGNDILRMAMDQMHDEFVKGGVETDPAFNLVLVLVLREVFLRKTIMIVADRAEDSVLDWIETEYDDWNEETKNKENNEH